MAKSEVLANGCTFLNGEDNKEHPDLGDHKVKVTRPIHKRVLYTLSGIAIFLTGCVIGYFGGNYVVDLLNAVKHDTDHQKSAFVYTEWQKQSVFAPLSVKEMDIAKNKILQMEIIKKNNSKYTDDDYLLYDMIFDMHLHVPEKSKVLKHLDRGGEFPGRYATVYVYQGSYTPPAFIEYIVGPLEKDSEYVNVTPTRNLSGPTFNKRPSISRESSRVSKLARDELSILNPLLQASFNGLTTDYNKTMKARLNVATAPLSAKNLNKRMSSCYLEISTHLTTLDIIPVSATVHHDTLNIGDWYIDNIYYYNQGPFANTTEMMDAYNNGTLSVVKFPDGYLEMIQKNRDYLHNESLPLRDKANLRPSITQAPKAPRYVIKGHKVEWMGWSFELSTNTFRGPNLFDIKFKGERIVYEISLNDLNLFYSAGTVGAGYSNIIMSDVVYMLGTRMTFIKGIDCPEYATLVKNSYWHRSHGDVKGAFCVFEVDGQRALWRHAGTYNAGLRDHYLAVRAPASLGNYDYVLEFEFYLDGKMGTYVTSSGVVYSSYWYDGGDFGTTTPFGFRVAERAVGSIHDHTFLFKLDFDVINTQNSFEFVDWKSGSLKDAFLSHSNASKYTPPYPFECMRYVQYRHLERESGIHLTTQPTFWTVVNNEFVNKWGNKRGYKISHTQEYAEILPEDHPAFKAFPHLKYACAVTKRKDAEQFASFSYYDLYNLENPEKNLDFYLNNESVEDTDIVAWLNVRFFHLPTAEDVPITTGVRRGFLLTPFNFFDNTPTFDMQQFTSFGNGTVINEDWYNGY